MNFPAWRFPRDQIILLKFARAMLGSVFRRQVQQRTCRCPRARGEVLALLLWTRSFVMRRISRGCAWCGSAKKEGCKPLCSVNHMRRKPPRGTRAFCQSRVCNDVHTSCNMEFICCSIVFSLNKEIRLDSITPSLPLNRRLSTSWFNSTIGAIYIARVTSNTDKHRLTSGRRCKSH